MDCDFAGRSSWVWACCFYRSRVAEAVVEEEAVAAAARSRPLFLRPHRPRLLPPPHHHRLRRLRLRLRLLR